MTKDFSEQVFIALVQASNDELSIAKDLTVTAINNVMSKRISADDVENAKKRVRRRIKIYRLNDRFKNASIELGRYAVIQNEFYDPNATEELTTASSRNVEPVKILQGQIIVEEGKLIKQEIYRQLELVGLLDNEKSFKPFIGLIILDHDYPFSHLLLFLSNESRARKKTNESFIVWDYFHLIICYSENYQYAANI